MELTHIAQGWYNFVVGSPETKQLMAERLAICDGCPHKVQISSAGQVLLRAINQQASLYSCGLCGCPLAGLTAAPRKKCKAGKWGAVPNTGPNNSSSNSYYG